MECHLHLGAHRTGTTATQKLLEARQHQLREKGILFLGPDALRGWGLFETVRMMMEGRADPERIKATQDVLADGMATGGEVSTLVISDENLTGSLSHCHDAAALYPDTASRLSAFAKLLPVPAGLVCFTIREPDAFWKSAHAHLASRHRVEKFNADRLAASSTNSWLPVLQAIRVAFPKARFRILGYDPSIVARLLDALLGPDIAASLPKPKRTYGLALTGDDASLVKALPPGPERDRLSIELRARRDLSDRVFSDAQTQRLTELYAQDWECLRAGAVEAAQLDPGRAGLAA